VKLFEPLSFFLFPDNILGTSSRYYSATRFILLALLVDPTRYTVLDGILGYGFAKSIQGYAWVKSSWERRVSFPSR
jgi:hypothetical protein